MKRISIQVDKNIRKVILNSKRSRLITAFIKACIILCTWRYHLISSSGGLYEKG